MRKFLTLALALVMLLSLSVTAFAADSTTNTGGDSTIKVYGTYNASAGSNVVSVDVAWENMSFTYNAASTGTWQPGSHTYSGSTDAGWAENNNKITVTNHSNVDVTVSFSFAKASGIDSLTGSFSGTSTVGNATISSNSVKLNAGVENKPNEADKVEAKLTLEGALPSDWTAGSEIGTITVNIASASN